MQLGIFDISLNSDEARVVLPNDAEFSFRRYAPHLIDGLAGGLADGATFVAADGCTVTRYGDYELWVTPPEVRDYQPRRLRYGSGD